MAPSSHCRVREHLRRKPRRPNISAELNDEKTASAEYVLELYEVASKLAGVPGMVGSIAEHAGAAVGGLGKMVTQGASRAAGMLSNTAPQTAKRFAPQIAKGLGMMAANPRATGAAALGTGAVALGGLAAATR